MIARETKAGVWAFPDADDFMWRELTAGGYQRAHLDAAMKYVTDRRRAVDGGAHVGQFARPLAALFDDVLAFEPALDSLDCLRANVQAWGRTNITIIPAALGAKVGIAALALDAKQAARKNTGGRYVVDANQQGEGATVVRLDDYAIEALGLLKLDVEGYEPFALEGALDTLARCRPIVLFENKAFWTRYGLAADAPQQILTRAGYRFLESVGHDAIWGPA